MDVQKKHSTFGDNIAVLDGIRGLAVLIVLASHTAAFGMYGQGSLGVLLFFFLSGYVLTIPYTEMPEKILSLTSLRRFFLNRILRILPVYLVIAALTMLYLERKLKWYIWNISFIKGWNHFWSVAEEARFYLLFPLILIVLAIVRNKHVNLVILIALIVVFYEYKGIHTIDMMNGRYVNFYFYIFLGGCLTCFLVKYPLFTKWFKNKFAEKFFSGMTILIFLFLFFSSTEMVNTLWRPLFPGLPENFAMNGWRIPHIWLSLFIIFFFGLTYYRSGLVHALLNNYFFRHIGLLSYSIYLSHMIFLFWLRQMNFKQEGLFFTVLGASYLFSLVCYVCIEKPFLQLKYKFK